MENTFYFVCMQNDEEEAATTVPITLGQNEQPTKDRMGLHALYQLGLRDPAIFSLQQVIGVKVSWGGKTGDGQDLTVSVTTELDPTSLAKYVRDNYMTKS